MLWKTIPPFFQLIVVYSAATTCLLIGVSEILQELRNIIAKHVIHSLYHFRLQLLKFIDAVAVQNLPKVLHIWEVTSWKMELPLDLFFFSKKKLRHKLVYSYIYHIYIDIERERQRDRKVATFANSSSRLSVSRCCALALPIIAGISFLR